MDIKIRLGEGGEGEGESWSGNLVDANYYISNG